MSRLTIDDLLARARLRLDRVTVDDALDAVRDGAVLVDIRSEVQRARDGIIPGAIFHPRNALEWRCDASSGYDDARLSGDLGRRIVLVCNEGYQSSLAAATLQDLGFARATDLVFRRGPPRGCRSSTTSRESAGTPSAVRRRRPAEVLADPVANGCDEVVDRSDRRAGVPRCTESKTTV